MTAPPAPRVSVIMPVFNAAGFVAAAIASVQAQTMPDWELFAIEDGSTDDSLAILHKLTSDPRIHILSGHANQGPGPARNRGIAAATGRYIAFLDADDLWHPEKLACQLAFMAQGHVLTCTGYQRITLATGAIADIGVPVRITRASLLRTNSIACSSAIYDATHFGPRQMPALPRRQDFAFWLSLLESADAAGLNQSLMTYRERTQSVSSAKGQAAASTWAMYRGYLHMPLPQAAWYFANYALRGWMRRKTPALARSLGWLQATDAPHG
jgi:teichuronic acid biosynthesis glycosyltransferase TuaG